MRIILCCLLLLAVPCCVSAQKMGLLSGRVLSIDKTNKNPYSMWSPMPGATAQLVTSARDTLLMVTDRDGVFTFKQIPQGKAFLEISFIGYQTRKDTVQIERNTILRFLEMKADPKKIEKVVVKGKIPLVNRIGDTLSYNAAAMPTLADDEAIRIVEQIPGAEIVDGVVKIQGEAIVRSYVNGKLLFGDDAMSVLNNLLASDVSKIKVYDEVTDEDRRSGHTGGRKQKVLDLVTKNPMVSAVTGHFLASMGSDIDRGGDGSRRLRYGAGVTSNFFSEKLLIGVNAFGNNINRQSNRLSEILESGGKQTGYNRDALASLNVERFWGDRRDGSSLQGGYTYIDKSAQTREISRRNYFETASNPVMEYVDTTSSDSRRYSHEAFLNVDLHGQKSKFLSGFRLTNKFTYETNEVNAANSIHIMTPEKVDYTNTRSRSNTDGYTIQERLSWNRYSARRIPGFSVSARISDNMDTGWRVDTLSSTSDKRVLESNGGYFSQSYDWSAYIQLLKPRKNDQESKNPGFSQLRLSYNGGYEDSRKHKLSLNLNDAANPVDTANTMDYTYNYLKHGLSMGFFHAKNPESFMFLLNVGVDYKSPQKSDRFPVNYDYQKYFITPTVSFSANRRRNGVSFATTLRLNSTVPSIEQITARIDDVNPLQLRAGNPNLKPTQTYAFTMDWSKTFDLTGKSVGFRATADYINNAVTTRSRFFAEPTKLPDWENYQTLANATLSTFENVSGNFSGFFQGFYSFRPARWMTIQTNMYENFSRRRYYVGDALSTTDTYYAAFGLNLNGTIATKLRYKVFTSASYTYSTNTLRDNSRNLGWNFTSTLTYDPLKWLFAQAMYSHSGSQFYTQTGTDLRAHTLNAVVGCKAYKGMFTVSLSVYDLLNKGTSFSTLMSSNYVLTRITPSFGRYWLVNVGIKFNRNKGGKEYQGRMNDGSVDASGLNDRVVFY